MAREAMIMELEKMEELLAEVSADTKALKLMISDLMESTGAELANRVHGCDVLLDHLLAANREAVEMVTALYE